jgi:alpha-L-fucosidase 2
MHNGPAARFFEGALLGNGGLGAVVMARPDAIVVALGHNNVWDIRVAEHDQEEIGSFQEVFERVRAIPANLASLDDDDWYRDYCERMARHYREPYPRPFPCGTLVLGFDRRHTHALGYRLDVATGVCDVAIETDRVPATVQILVDPHADRLWLRAIDEAGAPTRAPFNHVRLLPDSARPTQLWSSAGSERRTSPYLLPDFTIPAAQDDSLSFCQTLPASDDDAAHLASRQDQVDRAFQVTVRLTGAIRQQPGVGGQGPPTAHVEVERGIETSEPFYGCLQLDEGTADEIASTNRDVPRPSGEMFTDALERGRQSWGEFWSRSGVSLDDELLERTWYHNLYFFNCSVKPGVTCPGLFANWSRGDIGTAWHGDYHLNYNTQQAFWAAFSSNHVDKHLAYVDLVDHLLPLSRRWAHHYYGLRGACFPHSAYPVDMNVPPYPVPTWGWEISETPWAVQSLWWHYIYTQDVEFLRERAFPPIREAVLFLVDYMLRPEAHGDQWGDGCYHIFPTVVPELYGLTPGLTHNADCLADLTLTQFIFKAYLKACTVLELEVHERSLMDEVRLLSRHFPPYPTAESRNGRVFVSVVDEDPETVYNVPVPTMAVFPGEDQGLDSDPETFEIAVNTYRNQQNEGGNDLVFLNLQGARLGELDLDRFKRQIEYCLLPNGTCTNMVLQVGGRYRDETPFDFMAPMGVWFENFALPAVLNECLLQSYNGVIRLFPNWPAENRAEFRTLRAVGAFLVSAACANGAVDWVEVVSEAGGPLRLANPWQAPIRCTRSQGNSSLTADVVVLDTSPGETLRFVREEEGWVG